MPTTPHRLASTLALATLAAVLCSCANLRAPAAPSSCGIEVVALRRSAGGNMLDFRYRVIDPEKARPILDRRSKAYLIDQASGTRLGVPDTPKVGPLRQTAREPIAGLTYFVIFSNSGKLMRAGDLATVVIGDFRAENVVVE